MRTIQNNVNPNSITSNSNDAPLWKMQHHWQNDNKGVLEPWQQDHWGVSGEEESNDAKESDDN